MKFEPNEISETLARMLRRVGRPDLIAAGFDVDDEALARSNALTRDRDHAIYHALFDKSAAHAAVIRPLPPPQPPPETARAERGTGELLAETRGAREDAKEQAAAALDAADLEHRALIAASSAQTDRIVVESARVENAAAARERRAELARWAQIAVLIAILAALFAGHARAQPSSPLVLGGKAAGTTVAGSQRISGAFYIDCGASTTFTAATSTLFCPGTGTGGTGSPGGALNSVQYNSSGSFAGIINTTATREFLLQTSSGTPSFTTLLLADLPLSAWTGSAAITTLGTITTGTWNATAIANAFLANPSTTVFGATCTLGATCTPTLPNPSATTLGGVESITSAAHNWIAYINTSGVPVQARPACADLSDSAASCATDATNAGNIGSGTLPAGRLPNPSATTLGGVESITSAAHNFVTSISTAGVPSQAQPAFSDLNGAATAAQIPAALSSTTSVNGTSIPSSGTLTQTIASGTSALGTSSIASAACATVVTTTATGTATTDAIAWNPNGSIKAVTGYVPASTGGLSIAAYPTSGNVNFDVCNWTSSAVTPGAITLNWRVTR